MSKGTEKEKRIIALAYFHRYGWIAAMMACIAIWPKQMLLIFLLLVFPFRFGRLLDIKRSGSIFIVHSKILITKK